MCFDYPGNFAPLVRALIIASVLNVSSNTWSKNAYRRENKNRMDRGQTTFLRAVTLAVLVVGMASLASAQLTTAAQPIALNATLNESLTLNLSANAVSFPLTAGSASNPGSTGITATTTWVLKPGRTAVGVYAYFANAAAALSDTSTPANNIPSSAFFISDNGGASTALTSTTGFGGANAGLQLENIAITGTNKNSKSVDNMTFNINLSGGTLPQLPAGAYNGTLNIQAQATP